MTIKPNKSISVRCTCKAKISIELSDTKVKTCRGCGRGFRVINHPQFPQVKRLEVGSFVELTHTEWVLE